MNEQKQRMFVDRRSGRDRRQDQDSCAGLPIDLYHRKRRKNPDRRAEGRTLAEDMAAFFASQTTTIEIH